MKKLNMLLAVSTLFSLVTFTGCGNETSSSTNRVSNTTSSTGNINSISVVTSSTNTITSDIVVPTVKKVKYDISVKTIGGRRLNNVEVNFYDGTTLIETLITNYIGNVSIELEENKEYIVKLGNIPMGVKPEESYTLNGEGGKTELLCLTEVIDDEAPEDIIYREDDVVYNFYYEDLNGNENNLKSLFEDEGKDIVILTFWATWCGYCLAEFPFFNQADRIYGDRIEILGLNVEKEDTVDIMQEYYDAYGITWTWAQGNFQKLYFQYNFGGGIPATVFISKYGFVELAHMGQFPSADHLLNTIDEMLLEYE